jgi:hypothetical protein
MSARLRCSRGHFISATSTDRACHCVLTPRPRRRRRSFSDVDLWGQGLTVRQKYRITLVPITGSYL